LEEGEEHRRNGSQTGERRRKGSQEEELRRKGLQEEDRHKGLQEVVVWTGSQRGKQAVSAGATPVVALRNRACDRLLPVVRTSDPRCCHNLSEVVAEACTVLALAPS